MASSKITPPIAANTMVRKMVVTVSSGSTVTFRYKDGTIMAATRNMSGLLVIIGNSYNLFGTPTNIEVTAIDTTNHTLTIKNTSNYSGDFVVYEPF